MYVNNTNILLLIYNVCNYDYSFGENKNKVVYIFESQMFPFNIFYIADDFWSLYIELQVCIGYISLVSQVFSCYLTVYRRCFLVILLSIVGVFLLSYCLSQVFSCYLTVYRRCFLVILLSIVGVFLLSYCLSQVFSCYLTVHRRCFLLSYCLSQVCVGLKLIVSQKCSQLFIPWSVCSGCIMFLVNVLLAVS